MISPVKKDKKKGKLLEVRWITISYKTLALVVIPFLILVIGGTIYLYITGESILDEAKNAMKTARIELDNADEAGAKVHAEDKFQLATDLLEDAQKKIR